MQMRKSENFNDRQLFFFLVIPLFLSGFLFEGRSYLKEREGVMFEGHFLNEDGPMRYGDMGVREVREEISIR